MSKVRGIRFNAKEDALVEEFLASNPLIDFTTLAKISILEFIKKPQINLHAVGKQTKKAGRNVRPVG
ncbi:MAG: hypothetical protein KF767_12865 [Bdellovibrionaceae bacterium]|nr:hypothetical protein [Pseudobdellovibrionaceae bacterium]